MDALRTVRKEIKGEVMSRHRAPFTRKCAACKGRGKKWHVPMILKDCSACNGLGFYVVFRNPTHDDAREKKEVS